MLSQRDIIEHTVSQQNINSLCTVDTLFTSHTPCLCHADSSEVLQRGSVLLDSGPAELPSEEGCTRCCPSGGIFPKQRGKVLQHSQLSTFCSLVHGIEAALYMRWSYKDGVLNGNQKHTMSRNRRDRSGKYLQYFTPDLCGRDVLCSVLPCTHACCLILHAACHHCSRLPTGVRINCFPAPDH